MSKLLTSIVIIFTIQAIFAFSGFVPDNAQTFNFFKIFSSLKVNDSGQNIYGNQTSAVDDNNWKIGGVSLRTMIVGVFTLVAGGIAIGVIGGVIQPFYLLGTLAIFFLSLIADLISMIKYISTKAPIESTYAIDPFGIIIILIYGIMTIVYFFAVIDWWRGEM